MWSTSSWLARQEIGANVRSAGFAASCVATSTGCAYLLRPYGHLADLAMIQLLGIVWSSLRCSVRVSVIAAVASIVGFDCLLVAPSFSGADAASIITFAAMIIVAATVSRLSENLRRQ